MLSRMRDAPETRPEELPAAGPAGPGPYRNLFVPLILVPAMIVGAILLVFLFFGAIAGREASLAENLDRVVHGGQAERKQAAFNMVRQVAENEQARQEGREQESEERSWSHQALSEGKQRISLLCPGGRCLISGTGSSSFRPAVTFGPLDRRRLDGDEEEGPEARA